MENQLYKLREVSRNQGDTGCRIIYEVVDFDGDEEKLKETLDYLNSKCNFWEEYYDYQQYADGTRHIVLDITNLD